MSRSLWVAVLLAAVIGVPWWKAVILGVAFGLWGFNQGFDAGARALAEIALRMGWKQPP